MRAVLPALFVASVACSATEPVSDGLIPFAVGNQWTYSIADSGQTATVHDSTVTVRILEEVEVGGVRWYRSDPAGQLGTYPSFGWFKNTPTGIHHALNPTTALGWLAWPYPDAKGFLYTPPIGRT